MLTIASMTCTGRDDQQAHRTAEAFGNGHDVRQQSPLVGRGRALAGSLLTNIDINQPRRHDDDVTIAWRLQRGHDMREGMGIANRRPEHCRDAPRARQATDPRRGGDRRPLLE